MLSYILAGLLALLMLFAISLNKTYQQITPKELRRQARQGDPQAKTLYGPISYGASLQVFLWTVTLLAAAASFVLFTVTAPAVLAFLVVLLILGLGFWWLPTAKVSSLSGRIALWLAAPIARILYYLQPIFSKVSTVLRLTVAGDSHTGIYEKEDLIELLEWQKQQADNRIYTSELELAEQALQFGDKKVSDVLLPRKSIHLVNVNETVGPLLMDELHKTQLVSFPVYEGRKDHIVGILYLEDLVNLRNGGSIEKLMKQSVQYLHEDFTLTQALQAFLTTKQSLFVVVDRTGAFIGTVSIEGIMQHLFAAFPHKALESYDSPESVIESMKQPILQKAPDNPTPEVVE